MHRATDSGTHVAVIGAGIGGLATALALRDSGHRVTLIDRDEAPPDIDPASAFDVWKRPGVPQLRHTHIFLARLQTILRRHHPELLAELEQAGVMRGCLDQLMPAGQAQHVVAEPGDEDLVHIWGRRATLEYLVRKHVGRLGHVQFLHQTSVEGLLVERSAGHARVTGLSLRDTSGPHTLHADVVVDASGRRSKSDEWLRAHGVTTRLEENPSRCGYYCRHYKHRKGESQPLRRGTGASLDYLVFGLFFAEQDTFSIAMACPEIERELLERLKRPDGFDEVCKRIPVLSRFIEHADPISRVLGGAELANRWKHFPRHAAGQVLGFFTVGDSYLQTNPIYGRGCSSAFVQAQALADALVHSDDPVARAVHYHRGVWKLMRPHFDFCVSADRAFMARARLARGEPMSVRDRLASHLYERAFLPAIEESPRLAREWLKAQQMCEVSPPRVAVMMLLYMAWLWMLRALSGAQTLLPRVGPVRSEMMRALLPAEVPPEDAG